MYASAWLSDADAAPAAMDSPRDDAPLRQRARGRVLIGVTAEGGVTRPLQVAEAGSLRVRLPNTHCKHCEAVLINTAGGIACGDDYTIAARIDAGAHLVVTTPAAEKVYRSDGPVSNVAVTLDLAAGSRLDWLPQETLLFDAARIRRRFDVVMAENASLTMAEVLMLGRTARGERMCSGLVHDRWSIRRGGRLVFADALRLEGTIADKLDRPAIGAGAAAIATIVHLAPDAMTRLDAVRAVLEDAASECGASAWNGMLVLRFAHATIAPLRRDVAMVLAHLRGAALPRIWMS